MSIAPRAVLITGANRGLGLEFVRQIVRFSTPPKYLFATCRNPESATSLQEMAKEHSCIKVMKFDVTDHREIQAVCDRTRHLLAEDGLNLIVNNAGITYKKQYLGNLTHSQILEQFDVNVFSPLLITQTFMPLLKLAAQKSPEESMSWRKAAVVNISSILGSIEKNENGGLYPYRASKAALNMVTKTQSIDLRTDGILTVAVHPGWVQTDMGGQSAPVTPTESLKGMLSLFSKLTEDSSGKFFDFNGEILPW
ncbi:C-signal-like isoform X1 [Argopecten irradians]|uniref:C-signal-like isoform X1 n=1 Tax=Argopecten irradians TaxID=31199 RepID=UPI0037127B74